MKINEFDVDYWESVWDDLHLPQVKTAREIHEIHRLLKHFLPKESLDLIEIGCAPGSWMAYFYNNFNYRISGVEYAPRACRKTVENFKLQNIPAEVFKADFFSFKHEPFDIVFSAGFIEHYPEVDPVIGKIAELCAPGGYVVTIIPSMEGVNWWISRHFRPHVAAGHFPLGKNDLKTYHEQKGLHTLYCNYIGSFKILIPVAKNNFSRQYPGISTLLNMPFRVYNRLVDRIGYTFGIYPKVSFLADSIIYIGKKR